MGTLYQACLFYYRDITNLRNCILNIDQLEIKHVLVSGRSVVKLVETIGNHPFENIFDITTAGDWDRVAKVERLPAPHYSVDFTFLSFWIMGFIVEL